ARAPDPSARATWMADRDSRPPVSRRRSVQATHVPSGEIATSCGSATRASASRTDATEGRSVGGAADDGETARNRERPARTASAGRWDRRREWFTARLCRAAATGAGPEVDDPGPHPSVLDLDQAHREGQAEPPRSRAAGIEEEDAVAALLARLVRVAGDHHARPAR